MTTPTPAPQAGPTSVAQVQSMLTLSADKVADLGPVVDAVNALVATWLTPGADGEWAAHHRYGATLLAARLYRRRDTPAGVLTFGMEGAVAIQRSDPDVAQLLGLGSYAPPRVG